MIYKLIQVVKKIIPVVIFLLLIFSLYLFLTKDGLKTTEKKINIQIEGAVKNPGIKVLKDGSITKDAIDAAGGYADNYDSNYVSEKINLVKKLQSGDKITIPFKKNVENSPNFTTQSTPFPSKININKADSKQLDSLPGVGEVTIKKIIANRPYLNISDLLTKKIVSNAVFKKIESQIEI